MGKSARSTPSPPDTKEAGPQLLLQAFLQRIVNGGGRIERGVPVTVWGM